MPKRYDLVVVGGATEDIFFTVDDAVLVDNPGDLLRQKLIGFEYGAKIGVKELNFSCGGGASNVSVGASCLSLKTAVITTVGKDERGKKILDNFKLYKIESRVEIVKQGLSGVSFILIAPDKEHVVFTYRGVNGDLKIGKREAKLLSLAKRTYLTSLSGGWRKLLPLLFSASNKVFWNPGREQLQAGYAVLKPYLQQIEILSLNKDEALELLLSDKKRKEKVNASSSLPTLLKILSSYGPQICIITDGAKGAYAYDGRRVYRQEAIKPKKITDTTGVGDSFGSGFVSGLELYHGDISKALKLAARNASSVIAQAGSQNGLLRIKRKR
ncbi:MAG: PfkB family carbohydrate kinase [Patescibacteria group bacterium]|nr:MAG: PfkB family carbohydrate kinase [Patescibacteria group bacterium]